MERKVPTEGELMEADDQCQCFWTDSIDYDNNQCRTLINYNSLTKRLSGALRSLPIHQTCEIRTPDGKRII